VLLGDFNAHNELWLSEGTEDVRSRHISDAIANHGTGVLIEVMWTHMTANCSFSPEIDIVSATPATGPYSIS